MVVKCKGCVLAINCRRCRVCPGRGVYPCGERGRSSEIPRNKIYRNVSRGAGTITGMAVNRKIIHPRVIYVRTRSLEPFGYYATVAVHALNYKKTSP